MTGWGAEQDRALRVGEKVSPSLETLAEIAAAGQRMQLENLLAALKANPDLAAQLYVALKRSP